MKLNWESAVVEDGTLTVSLEGDAPKGWKETFATTVKLLGDGDWGAIKAKKHRVRVDDVSPGSEDRLRHRLESIVDQVNASHVVEEEEDDGDDEPERGGGPDAEMTERFRAFAD